MKQTLMSLFLTAACSLAQTSYSSPPPGYTLQLNEISAPDPSFGCHTVNIPSTSTTWYGSRICDNYAIPATVVKGATNTDLGFGGLVRALTPHTDNAWTHRYSIPSPISANNRYVSVGTPGGGFAAIDMNTAPTYSTISMAAQDGWPSPMWDPVVGDKFYFFDSGRTKVMSYTISTATAAVVHDFTGTLTNINNGGSSHVTSDGWMPVYSETQEITCAVNTANGNAYCAPYNTGAAIARVGYSSFGIDYALMTKTDSLSGKRYLMLMVDPAPAIFSVNLTTGVLDFEARGSELTSGDGFIGIGNNDGICDTGDSCMGAPHADVTSIGGREYLVFIIQSTGSRCQTDLIAAPIASLAGMVHDRTLLLTVGYCSSPYEWPDSHISCSQRTGACVISTYSDHVGPMGNQIWLLRDLTHMTRLGYSYSQKVGCDTYWAFPRAAISIDSSLIIFDSNWNRPESGCTSTAFEQVFALPISLAAMTNSTGGALKVGGKISIK